jgi:endonuclease/exonuclease/phosphatase family metal-dependent hydrolase
MLKLLTFNILAPSWASPTHYPESTLPLLDIDKRRPLILETIKQLVADCDVCALQETQEDEICHYNELLCSLGFQGVHANHNDSYWEKSITPDVPFVSNGVALYWRTNSIEMNNIHIADLSDNGNRCIILNAKKDNKNIRIACLHLDSDHGGRRKKESRMLLDILKPDPKVRDIVIGDLNFDADNKSFKKTFGRHKFKDVLKAVGKEEKTHPYIDGYLGNSQYTIIDHVLVRNAKPINGKVNNFNVWNDGKTTEERVNLLFERSGTDHFPVNAVIQL